MTKQHPITPPPELVEQWYNECPEANEASLPYIATQAARWGFKQCIELDAAWLEAKLQKARDEELEACRLWVSEVHSIYDAAELLNQRRPKPPSLKEQSLALIDKIQGSKEAWDISDLNVVRRALESLPD